MENLRKNHKINQIGIIGLSIAIILLIFIQPIFSQEPQAELAQLEKSLEQSRYSGFQKRMIFDAAKELFNLGVNAPEIERVLAVSIANNFDAYNIKKIIDVLIDTRKSGISERTIMNKFKEGLAKKVDERLIVDVLSKEAENLKLAKNLLKDYVAEEATYDYDQDIVVESLAEGLNNGIPRESLSEVLSRSVDEGKNIQEIVEVSTELGNLSLRAYEMGFSEEEITDVFERAVLGRSGVDGICEDIQDMLIATAVARMNMASGKSSGGTGDSTSPSDITTGDTGTSDTTGIIASPGSGTSSSPTDADDKPDAPDKPDSDSSSPPEN